MLTMYKFEKIRKFVNEGKNNSEIARELGVSRVTVRKYRQSNAPPDYTPRSKSTRSDPFAEHEQIVRKWLKQTPTLTGLEIYDFLKDRGYNGSLRTVQYRLAAIRGEMPKERFFQQEYSPAEQCQIDFKESVKVAFATGIKTIHFHVCTLPYSGRFYIQAYPNRGYESFMDGVHRFFAKLGGMPKNIRIDNLAPCVRKVQKGNSRVYTEAFSRAIDYYGFGVLPCRPATGSDKGDVEREIRTHFRRIPNLISHHGLVFRDFEKLNSWLDEYCSNRQNSAEEKFTEEIKALDPLPPFREEIVCREERLKVSPHGMVKSSKGGAYSAPDASIGKWVRVVTNPFEVKIYATDQNKGFICSHKRITANCDPSIELEHVLPSLVRKPGAMLRWAHRKHLFPDPIFTKYYRYLRHLDEESSDRLYLCSMNLIQYTSLAEIAVGMQLVMEGAYTDPYDQLKALLTVGHYPPEKGAIPVQEKIIPDLSQYDQLLPLAFKEIS